MFTFSPKYNPPTNISATCMYSLYKCMQSKYHFEDCWLQHLVHCTLTGGDWSWPSGHPCSYYSHSIQPYTQRGRVLLHDLYGVVWYIRICTYIHCYTCTHAHTQTQTTHKCTSTSIHITCTHAHTRTYKYKHTHTHARARARTHTHTRTHARTHTHTHTHACTHTRIHMDTRAHTSIYPLDTWVNCIREPAFDQQCCCRQACWPRKQPHISVWAFHDHSSIQTSGSWRVQACT